MISGVCGTLRLPDRFATKKRATHPPSGLINELTLENVMKVRDLPPVEYLNECLTYDHDSGNLIWKARPEHHFSSSRSCNSWNAKHVARIAGHSGQKGYIHVGIDGVLYKAHRIIFHMVCEPLLPDDFIDHINGDCGDNRLCNLRKATHQQNSCNTRRPVNNTTGVKGVTRRDNGKYRARLWVSGKCLPLGDFDTVKAAAAAYRAAADEYHGEFANYGA